MNPAKAIEILTHELERVCEPNFTDICKATKLGIEALKRHQHNEASFEPGVVKPLSGETED